MTNPKNKRTAPKATEAYKNGIVINYRNYSRPMQFLEDKLKFGYVFPITVLAQTLDGKNPRSISEQVRYYRDPNLISDTAYVEIPEHVFNAFYHPTVKPRIATNKDKDRQEYETLKRRFNEAKSVSKHQQGGQLNMNEQELQLAFIQYLAQKTGAKSQLELEAVIQQLGEEGLKQAYAEFMLMIQLQQVLAAKFGAKLNYIKKLRGQCPEGYDMQYFKKGGQLCKKCVAKQVMEKGGEILDPIELFKCEKKVKKKQKGGIAENDTIHTKRGIRDLSGKTNYPKFNPKEATQKEKDRASEKDYFAGRQYIQGPVNKNNNNKKKLIKN